MKKIIVLVIIVGALTGLYFMNQTSTDVSTPEETTNPVETGFRPNPSNATFMFEEGPVTLSRGKNERSISPDNTLVEETSLTEHIAYGDLNSDGRDDTAVLLVRNSGASGLFVYVAGFVSGSNAYKGTNAIFLGDRISPLSVRVDNGEIVVEYLDRDPSEPFAAEPTISTTKRFVMSSGELVEK